MKYVKIYDSKGLCTGVADIAQNYDKAGYAKLFDSNMHVIGFVDVDNIPESGENMPFVQVFDENMLPCGVVTADNIRHSDGYLIKLQKDPSTTGSVSGGGRFVAGTSVTVVATPDAQSEYPEFDGWYEGETKVSENASYTFTVSGTRTLVAKFKEAVVDVNKWIAPQPVRDYAGYLVNSEGKFFEVADGMRSAPLIYKTDGSFVISENGHAMPGGPGLGSITVTCDASSGNSFTFEYNGESYQFVNGQPNGFEVPTIEF